MSESESRLEIGTKMDEEGGGNSSAEERHILEGCDFVQQFLDGLSGRGRQIKYFQKG